MRWRRERWPERQPRPKARKPSEEETTKILNTMNNAIKASPVLTALSYRVKPSRGRFYYEQMFPDSDDIEIVGRVTPLAMEADEFLLEVEYSKNSWKEIKQGKIRTLINAVSYDNRGTFHGLGALDKSIRAARKSQSDKLRVARKGKTDFYYTESDKKCSVQEVLFHYFDVPIHVIAEPREWYAYRRTPRIKEVSGDEKAILAEFMVTSWYGDSFGGTCLYIIKDKQWSAYTIRPNQSESIESSIRWLEKRKWVGW